MRSKEKPVVSLERRPELTAVLTAARANDPASWCPSWTAAHGVALVAGLMAQKVPVISRSGRDTDPFTSYDALAEKERRLISKQTKAVFAAERCRSPAWQNK